MYTTQMPMLALVLDDL